MTEAIVITALQKIIAITLLPAGLIQEVKDMLAQARTDAIFTSINAFRSELQKIIDTYDPSINADG
jgi:hypothetical protein